VVVTAVATIILEFLVDQVAALQIIRACLVEQLPSQPAQAEDMDIPAAIQ
jgi:hypothetical protein